MICRYGTVMICRTVFLEANTVVSNTIQLNENRMKTGVGN